MMKKSHSTSEVVECSHCNDLGYIYNHETNSCRECTFCNKLEKERQATRICRANIPKKYKDARIENFLVDIYPEGAQEGIKQIVLQCSNYIKYFERIKTMDGCTGLYLYSGAKGSGKTRMACSIANGILDKGIAVHYCTSVELLDRFRSTFNYQNKEMDAESLTTIMHYLINVPVLIIDDIGTEKQTDWVMEKLFEVIDSRVSNNGITIYTSNFPMAQLTLGTRIISRINESATKIKFPEVSIRGEISNKRNLEMQKFLLNPNG